MNLSIIGLDAKFADAENIDRFERLIYLGRVKPSNSPVPDYSVVDGCDAVVRELARQVGMEASALDVVLICQQASDKQLKSLQACYSRFNCVRTLAQAMNQKISSGITAVVAVSLAEQAALQAQASISLADDFSGYCQARGATGVLLADESWCKKHKPYIYAHVRGYGYGDDVAIACHKAIDDSLATVNDIQYVEVSALADVIGRDDEASGVSRAYRLDKRLHTALGSLRSVTGEGGCFSQLAGLVKTVLVLHQRYYPGTVDWQKPASNVWQETPFYIPVESRPWFPDSKGKPMMAAYSCMTNQDYCHFVLAENTKEAHRINGYIASGDLALIPISANTEKQLQAQLQKLGKKSEKQTMKTLSLEYYQQFLQKKYDYTLCLLAESIEELQREVELAKEGVTQAFAKGREWKTPKGSFFTPEPVGQKEDVAFLYPGIGASYVGLGRDIFHLFPEIYQSVAGLAEDIGASLKDTILNPRSIERLGFHDIKALDHELRNSLANIAECGVGFACVFTRIFEEVFDVHADFATGYSMGEVSMYAALGCWEKPGQMSKRLAESDTFNHRLTGELQTLRQHWDLPPAKEGEIEQLWETYTLKATPEEIAEASMDEDRVYCTIVNTPDSLVIGGYPEACQRVIKKLGVRAMPLDMPNAIHSEPAFKEYEHMEKLYTMDVAGRVTTSMYSSSCYLPIPQRSKAIANSIARCLCERVDFPRLINTMYDKGARVFIEMGPGRSLCSWVEKILKHDEDKPHVSVPVNAKGTSDELTIVRAIAKLVSHGVDVNMSKLYYGSLLAEPPAMAGKKQAI